MNRKKETSKKPIIPIILVVLLALLAGAGALYYFNAPEKEATSPEALTVKEMPAPSGVVLELPNLDANGQPKCAPKYDGSEVVDGTASAKFNAKKLKCDPVKILEIPIEGPCPVGADGVIGAPNNWTMGCSHSYEEGGMSYLGHSVRGPRIGAFENIDELQIGQKVKVEEKIFTVVAVNKVPTTAIPVRLTKKGHFSLITCYIDSAAELGGPISTNTIVELSDR